MSTASQRQGRCEVLSLFNNPEAIASRGMVPAEIDQSTLPEGLSIEQRGGNLDHFDIVPANAEFIPQEEFQQMLNQIGVISP
jgi:hypothetical protein